MSEAFISYSRRNKEFVQKLIEGFAEQKRDIWVDWEDIPLGSEWWEEIKSGIEKANAFVFVLSLDSVTSQVCGQEIEHALQHNKRIIPIICKSDFSNDQVHPKLASINWIFFDPNDFASSFQKLLSTLDSNLEHAKMHTRLLTRALEWEEKKRNNSFLLFGRDLADAESWLAGCAGLIPKPTPLHTQYILEGQRMKSVRQKRLTIAAMVVLCITLGLGVFAETQREKAVRARQSAEKAREMADKAREAADRAREMAETSMIKAFQANAEAGLLSRDYLGALISSTAAVEKLHERDNPNEAQKRDLQYNTQIMRKLIYNINQINELSNNDRSVRIADFTSDGKYIISLSSGNIVKLWTSSGKSINDISLENNGRALGFKKDGTFAVCDTQGTVFFYQPEDTGAKLLDQFATGGDCNSMIFSADGQWMTLAKKDKQIYVYDVPTKQLLMQFAGHTGTINDLTMTGNKKWLASAANDNTVIIWNTETKTASQTLRAHTSHVYNADFSPDNKQLVTGSADQSIILWDFDEPNQTWVKRQKIEAHSNWVLDVAFSPNNEFIASSGADNLIKIWSRDGTLLWMFGGHSRSVRSVNFSPDSETLVSAGKDKRINLYDLKTPVMQILYGFNGSLRDINYSPDNKWLVTVSSGNEPLKIWTTNGILKKSIDYKGGGLRTVDFRNDSQQFAIATTDGNIILWDINGNEVYRWNNAHQGSVKSVMFSTDNQYLASCGTDHIVNLWNAKPPYQLLKQFKGHDEEVLDIVFSPDRKHLASASADNTVRIWDIETGEFKVLRGHKDWVNTVYYNADGSLLLSASSDGTAKIWDTAKNEMSLNIDAHPNDWVWDAQFSSDNKFIATAGSDGIVKLWSLQGHLITELYEHSNWVRALTFSPDNKYLATAGADQKAILWNLNRVRTFKESEAKDETQALIDESCKWLAQALATRPQLQNRMCQPNIPTQPAMKLQ